MKRIPPHTLPEYGISKIKPIFAWTRCDICKMEFRREYIWECFIRTYFPDTSIYHNICMHCAPTIEDVIRYRTKVRELYNTPPSPPKSGTEQPPFDPESVLCLMTEGVTGEQGFGIKDKKHKTLIDGESK